MTDHHWGAPETAVLRHAATCIDEGRPAVMATIVAVEGSAYRRPGAKMIVEPDGVGRGTITAGCLEDEIERLVAEVIADDAPRLETYDLRPGEDDVWGLGVGCNGVIDVLLEPVDAGYRRAVSAVAAGEPIVVATTLGGAGIDVGDRAYFGADGGVDDPGGLPDWLLDALADPAGAVADRGRSEPVTIATPDGDETVRVFLDGLRPPDRLIVFGAGHDVGPIVALARRNEFRVTVVGFRGGVDLEDRFPDADETVRTAPARIRSAIDLDERTYAVLATHNFVDDRLALDELLRSSVPYIGLLGPRDRFEEMREAFAEEGRTFSGAELERIYTPVGLDLGGGTPAQIATSIVAEVLAVANDREPGHLSAREGPIHERFELATEADGDD